jgi:hypothetical protein
MADKGTTERDGGVASLGAIRISPRLAGVPDVPKPQAARSAPRGATGRLGIPNRVGAGRRVSTRW